MTATAAFFMGSFFGVFVAIFVIGLCHAAKRADDGMP
jgi:hypothetical protein